jgi:hypothetical protein
MQRYPRGGLRVLILPGQSSWAYTRHIGLGRFRRLFCNGVVMRAIVTPRLRWDLLVILSVLGVSTNVAIAQQAKQHLARDEKHDFSDPKKTFDTYLQAIKGNDLKTAKVCYTISDNNASGALDVTVGLWIAFHRLGEAARNKLGARGWAELQEWNGNIARADCTSEALDRTRARLKDAVVTVTKDTAKLTVRWGPKEPFEEPVFHFSGEEPIAEFHRVKGAWKLDFQAETGLEKPADFFKPGSWGPMMRDQIQIVEQVIANLQNGKLTSAEQTIAELEQRFEALASKYDPEHPKERAIQRDEEQKAINVKVPDSTEISTGSLAWSSDHCPVIALSARGVRYVFWLAKGQEHATAVLPLLPPEYAFGLAKDPEWSGVPGVNVYQDGSWSKPGVLVEGKKNCDPVFAWCEGELVHLLLTGSDAEATNHLVFDPENKKWKKPTRLSIRLSQHDAFRHIGKTVHVASVEGKYVHYLKFDGREWSKPMRLDKSENNSNGVTRPRLAVDPQGTAYVGWWSATGEAGTHGLAAIRDGKASPIPFQFADKPIYHEEFDLGIDPQRALLVAYKPDLPAKDADAKKIHVRRWEGKRWTVPELIGGECRNLQGDVHIIGNDRATLVTWMGNEDYRMGGGVLSTGFRRFAVTDGKTWTPSRWVARQPSLRGKGIPVSAHYMTACVDKSGVVHMVWDTCAYCQVFDLDKPIAGAGK